MVDKVEIPTVVPTIFEALAAATGDIAELGVAKLGRNKEQGYDYRAMDDIYNVIASVLSKRRLVFVPNVLERTVEQRQTRNNYIMYNVLLKIEYTIFHGDGSSIKFIVYGEASDNADKGTNKCMTAALKYALIQIFAIPLVGSVADADAVTPESTVVPGADAKEPERPRGSVAVPKEPAKSKKGSDGPRKPEEPLDMNALADIAIRIDKASDDVDLAALAKEVYALWRDRRILEKAAKEWGTSILAKRIEVASGDTAGLVIKMAESFEKIHMITAEAAKVAVGSLKAKFNLE